MTKTKTQTLEELIKKGNYYYINKDLNSKNFPVPDKIQTEGWKIIRPKKRFTSQEALEMMKKEGCRPANAYELAQWKLEHGDELKPYECLVAFGQTWKDAVGYHWVPYVYSLSVGGFRFRLGYFEFGWLVGDCLLAFPNVVHKVIKLLNGEETLVSEEDFDELNSHQWHLSSEGYACRVATIEGKKKTVYLHQEVNKTAVGFQTDHINRNKLDNSRENLRTVTWSENQLNTGLRVDNVSGEKGISKSGKKWQVHLRRNGKRFYLGVFDTKEEAVEVRNSFCDLDTLAPSSPVVSLTFESDIKSIIQNWLYRDLAPEHLTDEICEYIKRIKK